MANSVEWVCAVAWRFLCKVDAKLHFLKLSKMNQKPSHVRKHLHTPHIPREEKKKKHHDWQIWSNKCAFPNETAWTRFFVRNPVLGVRLYYNPPPHFFPLRTCDKTVSSGHLCGMMDWTAPWNIIAFWVLQHSQWFIRWSNYSLFSNTGKQGDAKSLVVERLIGLFMTECKISTSKLI